MNEKDIIAFSLLLDKLGFKKPSRRTPIKKIISFLNELAEKRKLPKLEVYKEFLERHRGVSIKKLKTEKCLKEFAENFSIPISGKTDSNFFFGKRKEEIAESMVSSEKFPIVAFLEVRKRLGLNYPVCIEVKEALEEVIITGLYNKEGNVDKYIELFKEYEKEFKEKERKRNLDNLNSFLEKLRRVDRVSLCEKCERKLYCNSYDPKRKILKCSLFRN